MNDPPRYYTEVDHCVEETLRKVGRRVVLGTPLGLGKANHLVNEFFRRAQKDPTQLLTSTPLLMIRNTHFHSLAHRTAQWIQSNI